jgi:sugar fermentation stimulation protein A
MHALDPGSCSPLTLSDLPLARRRRVPLRARFVARPNRFVADVALGGDVIRAHLPNPGRLTGTLSPGCTVLLDGPCPGRRCEHTVVAAREARTWVGTVPAFANTVFPALWRGGLFPEIAGEALAAEVAHGRSRFDFAVDGAFVEVKSVTLARGRIARFPDAVTARGARHCEELGELARRERPVTVVFVAQRGDVDVVEPEDDVDPAFGVALRRAANRGVRVLACALDLGPAGAKTARRIPVRL